jgi:hypothetical protein
MDLNGSIRNWFEQVWNKGDESAIDRLLAPTGERIEFSGMASQNLTVYEYPTLRTSPRCKLHDEVMAALLCFAFGALVSPSPFRHQDCERSVNLRVIRATRLPATARG